MGRSSSRNVLLPLFLSILIHALLFLTVSLEVLWPKRATANRTPTFRVVSVEVPKPAEKLPPNPESRFLSNANRRESGQGKPSATPRLRREKEDKVPARRGADEAQKANQPAARPVPPSPPQTTARLAPPEPEKPQEPPKPERIKPEPPKPAPSPEVKEPEPPKPAPQARVVTEAPPPKPEPPAKQARAALPKPKEKPKPEPPRKKTEERKAERPKPSPVERRPVQKKVEVAKVQPPKEKPEPRKKPKEKPKPESPRPKPQDPLAMFRAHPKGRADAPKLDLSNEDADRIAKAGINEDLKKEEEGDAVSLDTRDFRYASYFAHIKRKIQEAWVWPYEARDFQGKLLLRFVLRSDGSLKEVRLLDSSGYRILDDEAMAAVTKAAPFKPFPPDFKRKLLPIEGTFIYEHQRFLSR